MKGLKIVDFVHFRMSLDIQPCPWLLSSHVKQACLPFLRCAALMYHYVTGVASPLELQGLPHFLLKDEISFSLSLSYVVSDCRHWITNVDFSLGNL